MEGEKQKAYSNWINVGKEKTESELNLNKWMEGEKQKGNWNWKTASQMHVAPQIAAHCWQYVPDVVPHMPQMMLLSTADIIQRLPLDGAGTF